MHRFNRCYYFILWNSTNSTFLWVFSLYSFLGPNMIQLTNLLVPLIALSLNHPNHKKWPNGATFVTRCDWRSGTATRLAVPCRSHGPGDHIELLRQWIGLRHLQIELRRPSLLCLSLLSAPSPAWAQGSLDQRWTGASEGWGAPALALLSGSSDRNMGKGEERREREDVKWMMIEFRGGFCKCLPLWRQVPCHIGLGCTCGTFGTLDGTLNTV